MNQFVFDEDELDYSCIAKHANVLQALADVSNSGVQIFDQHRKQIAFFSTNYGKMLGYEPADYEGLNYHFFESKIHPDEKHQLAVRGVSVLKMFSTFSNNEKLNHKAIYEYRMLNSENVYVRLVEQFQVLELDSRGQIWLMFSVVDLSPNQESDGSVKCQILNFRTGHFVPLEMESPQVELTKREIEILKLVKQGYLSKEISDQLSISVHTVNTHRYRFLEKLGANNSIEAVVFASKHGLLD
ncbi:LuxR C-terminal-related transcriptional regulator [Rudanella lutea]|uniref:LuxR C-terminal-related transcriptional regulator n=1 Tax=Rudanella lutea TaxID=451374 RepID=UPI0005C758C9|nr:LuxR C-terminal-related transcriptional regulator [Rudanella lutea]